MKMRRDMDGIPGKNKADIERILSLLETTIDFDIAILYGRYAGGRMRSEQGGYELLLLTRDDPKYEGWELEEYMKKEYPVDIRAERNLHIETANIHTFNNTNTASWFYWNIRVEGTIVYDSGHAPHGVFRSTTFKHVKAHKLALRQYEYFFTHGSDLLDEAERLWSEHKPALAAINLSYSAQFLLRAEETVFYGDFIQTSDLQKSFRRARVFSRKLGEAFDSGSRSDALFFEQLIGLRHAPRKYIDFVLPKWRYGKFLERLRMIQNIVRESCERHLFYLEHGKTKSQMEAEATAQTAGGMSDPTLSVTDDVTQADDTDEKCVDNRNITIHVDPTMATVALGLAKGYFQSLLENIEAQSGLHMDDLRKRQLIDTLDELYERCAEHTDAREVVDLFMRPKRDDIIS